MINSKVDNKDVEVHNMFIKASLEIEEKRKPTFISASMI